MSDYSRVSKDQLQSRMVDDVLQATLAVCPIMADALATIPELNESTGDKRAKIIARLELKLIYILDHVESLRSLSTRNAASSDHRSWIPMEN